MANGRESGLSASLGSLRCYQSKGLPHPAFFDSAQQRLLNLGNLMHVQERNITNRKCRDSGMTVGVGGVCSLTSEVLASLNKGVPPPAYFDWRGWFRAGLHFFRGDMTLRGGPHSLTLPILNILSLRKQRKASYTAKCKL
ncbi:hypothetical protein J6590_035988 [Homalodisca vitripennis]|nr:hypothetical protein J6590_035988 [Homalodisca vitripennis]